MDFQEGSHVELKRVYTEDIRKEIIAFANTDGGMIYIGVEDDGTVVGIDDYDSLCSRISASCRDSIKPDITMFISYERIVLNGYTLMLVRVQRGSSRPYYLGAKGLKPSGVYVRQGTSSAPASEEMIRRMIKESDGDSYENNRSLNQELTFQEAEKEFSERGLLFGEIQKKSLGLMNADGIYTNLGLLLSDQCPHIIKAATFQGTMPLTFHDRKEFTGSILKQLRDAYAYMEIRNQIRSTFQGLYRIDRVDYPLVAVREALLNAIVHRDYSYSASTLISIYDDRMELISYGGLAGGIMLEDALLGLSFCRNQKLAEVFYRLQLIEAYGTGLIKIRSSYGELKCRPEFLTGSSSFKVILPNCNYEEDKADENGVDSNLVNETDGSYVATAKTMKWVGADHAADEDQLIDFIRKQGVVSRLDIEAFSGKSAASVVRMIRRLRSLNQIESVGKGKNTRYVIKKVNNDVV